MTTPAPVIEWATSATYHNVTAPADAPEIAAREAVAVCIELGKQLPETVRVESMQDFRAYTYRVAVTLQEVAP